MQETCEEGKMSKLKSFSKEKTNGVHCIETIANGLILVSRLSKQARVQYGVVLDQALGVRYIVRRIQKTSF